MKPIPAFARTAACALAFFAAAGAQAALDLPQTDDPQVNQWIRAAGAEVERFLADPQGSFALPAESKPWPCEVPPATLTKVFGTRIPGTPQSDEEKRAWANAARGMKDGFVKQTDHEDVRIWPVKASCADGKLDGEVQAWIEFTLVSDSNAFVSRTRFRKFVQVNMAAGERKGLGSSRMLQLSAETRWNDPATQDMMNRNPSPKAELVQAAVDWAEGAQQPKSAQVQRIHVGGRAAMTTLTTTVYRPLPGNRAEMLMYRGPVKIASTQYKNGRYHGLSVRYPYSTGQYNVPGGQTCYDDGEEVKTTQCNFD
jgi:hypothetical protein